MSDIEIKLGRTFLKGLVDLQHKPNGMTLENVGAMFMEMASSIGTSSAADQEMRKEIARLAEYIAVTKKEIFAISADGKSETVINDASQHLDAVIKATEQATNEIMDAADAIQNAVAGVGGEKEKQITEAAVRLYDACTFQDITGQRITKVIKLLENIEERLTKLVTMFGGPAEVNGKGAPAASDKDLLNGPQLPGQASSQAEIDALFASLGGKN